jgi:hypothetical protein
VAVKFTRVPRQIGLLDDIIEMLGAPDELTVMLITLELAGFPVLHIAFEFN